MSLNKDPERYKMFVADTGLFVTLCFWDKEYTENVIYDKLLSDKLEANLGYIYENLISNAIKYGKENGHIWVNVSENKDDSSIVITVRDDGKGIENDAVKNIFKRFYREQRNSGEEGLGLGLSIVKLIVDAHKGKIEVESEPEKGTEFRIIF